MGILSLAFKEIIISEKQGRLLGNMCIHTTMNVVIPHLIIRHRHPAIIQSCYWMITQPKGGFSPLPSYIYQFIIKSLDFCLDNSTTIPFRRTHILAKVYKCALSLKLQRPVYSNSNSASSSTLINPSFSSFGSVSDAFLLSAKKCSSATTLLLYLFTPSLSV